MYFQIILFFQWLAAHKSWICERTKLPEFILFFRLCGTYSVMRNDTEKSFPSGRRAGA